MTIQFITSGMNGRNEKVILWRHNNYTYELEIGSECCKRKIILSNTEYYDAMEQFDFSCENYCEY